MLQKNKKKNRIHYAWWILLSCCLIQGASLGLINNCAGIYFVPVSTELGVSTGDLSLYLTFQTLVSCLGMLLAKRMLLHIPLRILMVSAACFVGFPIMALSNGSKLWHWYLSGALQGVGLTYLCYFLPSLLLPNWFKKKLGFAVGLSAAFAGITGAVMSWLLAWVIDTASWRTAYLVSGSVFLLMTVPVSLFLVRLSPEEVGAAAYGDNHNEDSSAEEKIPRQHDNTASRIRFAMIILVAVIAKSQCGLNSHLPTFGVSIPLVIADAAFLITCSMFGNMILKLLFGILDDRLGVHKTSYFVIGTITVAVLMMLSKHQILVCIGAFLYGSAAMFSSVQLPILVRSLWNKEQYPDVIAAVNTASALFYSLAIAVFGYLYDWFGSYDLCFLIILISLAVETICIFILFPQKPIHTKHSVV